MRTLVTFSADVAASNKAIMDGSLSKTLQSIMERFKPEAAYFYPQNGNRGCIMVIDLKDPSEIPLIAEPLFHTLNAKVEFTPVMNIEDLQKGLSSLPQS